MGEPRAKGRRTPFITGGDWSVGLNSAWALDQLTLLNMLGRGLRREYESFVEERLPEQWGVLMEQLEQGEARDFQTDTRQDA